MANGVPQQVGRVYVHNTPDGLCYRFLSVRLGSLSAASTSTVAVQRIKASRNGPRKTRKVSLIAERKDAKTM